MAPYFTLRFLRGVVLADDAVLGGVHSGKPGRGSENKAPFVAAVEFDDEGHPLHVRFDAINDLKGTTLSTWAKSALDANVHLVTGGLVIFAAAGAEVAIYGVIIVSPRKSNELEPFRWVNTFIANCKTVIGGTYHHFSSMQGTYHGIGGQHAPRYLAEFCYRFNRRFELSAMIPRLGYIATRTPPMPERLLILAEPSG